MKQKTTPSLPDRVPDHDPGPDPLAVRRVPRSEVRRRLLAAAARAFAGCGYDDSRLEDIARDAGFTKDARAFAEVAERTGARPAVVTAAALIMFAVFAGFVTAEDLTLKPIAFGLAVGIVVVRVPDPPHPGPDGHDGMAAAPMAGPAAAATGHRGGEVGGAGRGWERRGKICPC